MRTMIPLGCVMLLTMAGLASAQTQPGSPDSGSGGGTTRTLKKSALELALEQALKNNPDLRVAMAKAAEADAEVSRARAQVVQKVVTAYQAIESARAGVITAEANLERARALVERKAGAVAEVQAAAQAIAQAKAKLATAEAELNYLTGKESKTAEAKAELSLYYERLTRYRLIEAVPKGATADRLRKALEKKVTFKFSQLTASEALGLIKKEMSDIHIQADVKSSPWLEQDKVNASLTDVSIATALQLLEDALGNHRIVVREYGLLIVPQDKVPPGAVLLADFLKSKTETATPATSLPKPAR